MRTYEAVLGDVSAAAITETAQRFVSGSINGQSKTFAPSVAEFVDAAKRQDEIIEIRNQPRLPAPRPYRGTGSSPFERNRAKALAANAHLPVLFEDIGYDRWCHLSKSGQVPVGGKWVACLGTVYGPEPRREQEAAE